MEVGSNWSGNLTVYQKRLLAAILWLSLFPVGFAIDGLISGWSNQFTLSKILLWIDSLPGGVWWAAMGLFGLGLLCGHLYSPQDSILGPAAEDLKKVLITNLAGQVGPLIAIDRVSAQAFVDEVETGKS